MLAFDSFILQRRYKSQGFSHPARMSVKEIPYGPANKKKKEIQDSQDSNDQSEGDQCDAPRRVVRSGDVRGKRDTNI
jgi:hypothetical protein